MKESFVPLANAVIDLEALTNNYLLLKKTVGEIICVVKANAYGNGAAVCSRALSRVGASKFAVANLGEAIKLRRALPRQDAEILILGYTPAKYAAILRENRFSQAVISSEHGKELLASGEKLRVHIAIDTGMNRVGYSDLLPQTVTDLAALGACPKIRIEGIFTHFACADLSEDSETARQFSRFCDFQKKLPTVISDRKPLIHLCNSAAALRYPQMRADASRCGLALYGLLPSSSVPDPGLRPVTALCAPIIAVHTAEKGSFIGYGATYICRRRSIIATVPIGYGDGFLRSYSIGCTPHINGKAAPIVGRICMDMCMLDITDIAEGGTTPSVGDIVWFYPRSDSTALDRVASAAETINYEVITNLTGRLGRTYLRDGSSLRLTK
ncbi:MAG: alanine racemase [Clostridia bacterium]|nr:alanine racemase [Clostridia bacterium]